MNGLVTVFYFLVLAIWSVAYFLFVVLVFALTVAFDKERLLLHKVSRVWAKSMFLMNPLWKIRFEGRENLDVDKNYVITVNHQSMLDIPLLYVLPHINFKWVAKREVYRWPLFGQVLWMHGDITVEQGAVKSRYDLIRKGTAHLGRGTSIIIFPEGTRSKTGEIGNFKEGAFLLAKEAGVEILPCVIDGTKTPFKGWKTVPNTFTVKVMKPIPAELVNTLGTRELMGRVRETTVTELKEIRNKR